MTRQSTDDLELAPASAAATHAGRTGEPADLDGLRAVLPTHRTTTPGAAA